MSKPVHRRCLKNIVRFLALYLSLTLSLPNPALALRQTGLEEQTDEKGNPIPGTPKTELIAALRAPDSASTVNPAAVSPTPATPAWTVNRQDAPVAVSTGGMEELSETADELFESANLPASVRPRTAQLIRNMPNKQGIQTVRDPTNEGAQEPIRSRYIEPQTLSEIHTGSAPHDFFLKKRKVQREGEEPAAGMEEVDILTWDFSRLPKIKRGGKDAVQIPSEGLLFRRGVVADSGWEAVRLWLTEKHYLSLWMLPDEVEVEQGRGQELWKSFAYPLPRQPALSIGIGRDPADQGYPAERSHKVFENDQAVSRLHLELRVAPDESVTLYDRSRGGTYIPVETLAAMQASIRGKLAPKETAPFGPTKTTSGVTTPGSIVAENLEILRSDELLRGVRWHAQRPDISEIPSWGILLALDEDGKIVGFGADAEGWLTLYVNMEQDDHLSIIEIENKPVPQAFLDTIQSYNASGMEEGKTITIWDDVVEVNGDSISQLGKIGIPQSQIQELPLVQRVWRSHPKFFREYLPQVQDSHREINAILVYPPGFYSYARDPRSVLPDPVKPFRISLAETGKDLSTAVEIALYALEQVDLRARRLQALEIRFATLYEAKGSSGQALLLGAGRLHPEPEKAAGIEEVGVIRDRINLLPAVQMRQNSVGVIAGPEDEWGWAYGVTLLKRSRTATQGIVPVVFLVENEAEIEILQSLGVSPEVMYRIGSAEYPTREAALREATNYLRGGLDVAQIIQLGVSEKISPIVEQVLLNLFGIQLDANAAVQWKEVIDSVVYTFQQA